LLGVQLELNNRHRRDRRLVMRVEHAQKGLRDLGELVVDLVADPRGQVRERLDQPLHVRVGAALRAEAEPAGDLGVLLREGGGQLADVGKFPVVERQQLGAHSPTPLTSMPSLTGCMIESNSNGSGAGSTFNNASMRNRRVRSIDSVLPSSSTFTLLNRGS